MNTQYLSGTCESLEDYSALEHILLGDLRDALEEPSTPQTARWLAAVLDALLETLPREMELREEGGYLAEVVEQFPNWSDQVDRLRAEHRELYGKLALLRAQLGQDKSYARTADDVREALRDWMHTIIAHHRHERRLVQTAFNLEVGGEN